MEMIWRWRREGIVRRRKESESSVEGIYFLSRAAESLNQTFNSDFNFVIKYWVILLESVAVGGIIN